jgi:hypothetical protein
MGRPTTAVWVGIASMSMMAPAAVAAAQQSGSPGQEGLPGVVKLIALPFLGFLGKWVFDQWNADNVKRRDFAAKTTDKVVGLAWDHYWKLANITGTLGGLFKAHLRLVDAHLFVRFDTSADLHQRLDEIAENTARYSFPSFARVLHAFESFQFRGSNTYLLPHHASGLGLRRLYNQFIESLGENMSFYMSDLRLAIEGKTAQKLGDGMLSPPDLGSAQFEREDWFSDLTPVQLEDYHRKASQRYTDWIKQNPAQVAKAADALHAFSRLLTHELADLHAVWHNESGPFARRLAWRQGQMALLENRWAGLLDFRTVETLRQVEAISLNYTPLGVGSNQPKHTPEKQPVRKDQTQIPVPPEKTYLQSPAEPLLPGGPQT